MTPLFLVEQDEETGKVLTKINMAGVESHKVMGLLVCDLVRHSARAFKVRENDVWDWVEKERWKHTTEVGPLS